MGQGWQNKTEKNKHEERRQTWQLAQFVGATWKKKCKRSLIIHIVSSMSATQEARNYPEWMCSCSRKHPETSVPSKLYHQRHNFHLQSQKSFLYTTFNTI